MEIEPWWKYMKNQELSYILFHILGEITNREGFELTEQLKIRLLSVGTESWRGIPHD